MQNLAQRLMLHGQKSQTNLPTAIFGTASTVGQTIYSNQPPVRIGLWPIICATDPDFGMGLFAVLGYLLDRYQGVRVYRLCAMIEGEPESYEWQTAQSQFEVDDWQLDELDDNVGLWGTLTRTVESTWTLVLNVEDDLAHTDDEVKTFSYSANSIPNIIEQLPNWVADIAVYLDLELRLIAPVFDSENLDESVSRTVLMNVFEWELKIYFYLWGRRWDESQILDDLENLITRLEAAGIFGAWLAANAITRLMVFTDASMDEMFLPIIQRVIHRFQFRQVTPIMLATALYESQLAEEAFELLLEEIDSDRAGSLTYLTLAELYRRGGRPDDAVDILQDAIENGEVSADLYQRYADLLIAMEYSGYAYDTFVLIDPDEVPDDQLLWEAVEAYDAGLQLESGNITIYTRQLLQLVELDDQDDRFWLRFGQLVENDSIGQNVRSVVEAFFNIENLEPGILALNRFIQNQPDRVDGYINVAVLYTLNEDRDAALNMLAKARDLTEEADVLADIQQLVFGAEDPEFEMRLGEINDVVNAGNELNAEDVEFLERILERAPTFSEAYLLLAKAYIGWDETGPALETLMDAHRNIPGDPDVLALLSERLWDANEHDTALCYLNKGISQNPHHVPLLALAGQYLFEDGQEEAAKAYLARAEAISPRDPTLMKVRVEISRIIGQ